MEAQPNQVYDNDFNLRGVSASVYNGYIRPVYLQQQLPAGTNAEILDIGCGCGQMPHALQKKGYSGLHGIGHLPKEKVIPALTAIRSMYDLAGKPLIKQVFEQIFQQLYRLHKKFRSSINSSGYHYASPVIYTRELKALATSTQVNQRKL